MNDDYEIDEWAPWAVLIITLAGGFLRVLMLATKGLWLDETVSIWLAQQSLPDMLQWIVKIDPHPPLYYLLLHFWIAPTADIPYTARLLSALFSAATIPIIYLTGKRISGTLVGLVAAIFVAFSPFNIYYAQEARMYAMLMFTAGVAIYALARLLTDARAAQPIGRQFREYIHIWRTAGPAEPDPSLDLRYQAPPQTGWRAWIYRHRWPSLQTMATDLTWVTFIVFSAATLLTHSTAALFVLATNVFVLGLWLFQRIKKRGSPPALQAPSFANWVKAQVGIFLLWSPWLLAFIQQATRVNQEFWIPKPTWDIITQTLRNLLNASAPGQRVQNVIIVLLCILLGLGIIYYRKKLSILLFLATLFAVPVIGELLVSLHRPIFYDRTLIWITIPMFLLLAAGVAQLRFRLLMVLVVGIIATNYMFSTGDYLRFYQKEDWSTAAGYVANFAKKGDLVLFNSNFVEIPFNYYFEPWEKQYSIQVVKQGVPQDLLTTAILEPRMTLTDIPALVSLVNGYDRVWLVYSHDSYTDPAGIIPHTLVSQKNLVQTREFTGGKVELYGSPEPQ